MSFNNWQNADGISLGVGALGTTATTVALNATVSACLTAVAAALIGARVAGNSNRIEEALDHLQRVSRAITQNTNGGL